MKLNKRHLHVTIKMFIVGSFTTLLAYFIGINNYVTAGVIAILSIHLTKYDSFMNGIKRLLSGLYGVLLAVVIFLLFPTDYHLVCYIVILFIFPLTSYLFNIQIGIVPSLVLITHFLLVDTITFVFILEEVGILIIAIMSAFIINLVYPIFGYSDMDRLISDIDKSIIQYITLIANDLETFEKSDNLIIISNDLNNNIENAINEIDMYYKDKFFDQNKAYLDYLYMRRSQVTNVYNISSLIKNINMKLNIANPIIIYIKELAPDISRNNLAIKQLHKLNKLLSYYRKETSLPTTRDEFESRALLYQIIYELKALLEVKLIFHNKHPEFKVEVEN